MCVKTLVLHHTDFDRTVISYNADLLEMLQPQLEKALSERQAQNSISQQVKWILKRLLPDSHLNMTAVARDLGVSEWTLQRPISEEGTSFRQLLAEARQRLTRQYLAQPAIEMNEIAFLLGYEDPSSFYRVFRACEGHDPHTVAIRSASSPPAQLSGK